MGPRQPTPTSTAVARGSKWAGACGALAIVLAVSAASAETWAVSRFSARGIDADSTDTFVELLESELGRSTGTPPTRLHVALADGADARAAGTAAGVDVVVFGSVNALGSSLIVRASAIEVATGAIRAEERMTATYVEELELIAERLAAALVGGRRAGDTAALGNLTERDRQAPPRREADHGFGLNIGTVIPTHAFAGAGVGISGDLSYVYEAPSFAIQPRVGVRVSAENRDGTSYVQVPIDIGAFWIVGRGDLAFLTGGGFGVRWVREHTLVEHEVPGVVSQTHTTGDRLSRFGAGGYGRVGMMLFRTYSVRMVVHVDFDVTFVRATDDRFPMAVLAGVGIIL